MKMRYTIIGLVSISIFITSSFNHKSQAEEIKPTKAPIINEVQKHNIKYIDKTKECNNYSDRKDNQILMIVDHITTGSAKSTTDWFLNGKSEASAHYLVCKNGDVIQFVNDENVAWHCGIKKDIIKKGMPYTSNEFVKRKNINPNLYTIGIEHESEGEELTEKQYESTLELHKKLIKKYNIKLDKIIGHCEIDNKERKFDPGNNFPWGRLMDDLKK
jgi:N-acetylmuramoyl-L-alanine amidase